SGIFVRPSAQFGYIGARPSAQFGYIGARPSVQFGYIGARPSAQFGYIGARPSAQFGYIGARPSVQFGYIGARPTAQFGYIGARPSAQFGYIGARPSVQFGYIGARPTAQFGYIGARPSAQFGYIGARPSVQFGYIGARPSVQFRSPKDPSQWLIKRVVALEGDQVKADSCFEEVVDVPKGHCWVEGDNRRCSMDSNNFGPVSMGLITAKATHVIWPPSRWGRLDKKEITGERVTLRENTDRGRVFFGWEVYPHSGNTITFFAFVFNCIEGLVFTTRFLTKPSAIPMRCVDHEKEYKITKYLSVILITIGIAICTIASFNQNEKMASHTGDAAYDYMIWVWWLLVLSLFCQQGWEYFKNRLMPEFGKHPSEALFYNHFLPLPGFLLIASDILGTLREFNQSEMYSLPYFTISLPWAWLWLFFNTVSQFVCIKSVFILTTECTSLTVTLVVTLRKFISLVFSIIYFKNPFTLSHWFGAALVFLGTLMFVEIFNRFEPYRKLEETLSGDRKKKVKL
ncbi:hypothetical protein Btru_039365, partial [Bulinus truncatus]